jgi:23S rRNA pseudouridine2605 synthase
MYASLTKKNVERGKWRYLSDKEVRLLKYSVPTKPKSMEIQKKQLKPEEMKTLNENEQ